jgi:hypothetical protein
MAAYALLAHALPYQRGNETVAADDDGDDAGRRRVRIDLVAGALLGAEDDRRAKADPDVSCAHCNALLGSTFLGALGLGAGAAVGAVAGTFDGP